MVTINISQDNYEDIQRAKEIFLKLHPEFKGKKITNNHMVEQFKINWFTSAGEQC